MTDWKTTVNEVPQTLKTVLKRLRLSGLLDTLPDRISYTKKAKLSHFNFLELILQDEIDRRDNKALQGRLHKAGFEAEQTLEGFDWDAPVTFDRDRVRDLFGLGFLERFEDVIILGPVGVGKTHLAAALGHAACRGGHRVTFLRADKMLRELHQSGADNTRQKAMARLLSPDLLIIDDFGLRRMNAQQSSDLYEVIIERHKRSSTIVTSNRDITEWIPLFDNAMLAQSAIDRLAHNAYQLTLEGESYRSKQRPGIASPKPGNSSPEKKPSRRRRRMS
jgi:DNA replication protein DnaC